jgi:hypothetical protein
VTAAAGHGQEPSGTIEGHPALADAPRHTNTRSGRQGDPVHIRDFHATVLQLLGFDHERFTYRHLGLDFKLTGVEHARVIPELMA